MKYRPTASRQVTHTVPMEASSNLIIVQMLQMSQIVCKQTSDHSSNQVRGRITVGNLITLAKSSTRQHVCYY
jgi:hypothetical protein